MAKPDVAEARRALDGVGERTLSRAGRAPENLLVHMGFARLTQRAKGGGITPAFVRQWPR
jgi:hypothetical protein